ncbi:MAG: hypothetical protein C5B48_14470 [Candidatus Rokuibacteriota bacterium]|nr:MAG: hypothetical protein C5B48_14470 [Candidatus Rokubacteria bacterium]
MNAGTFGRNLVDQTSGPDVKIRVDPTIRPNRPPSFRLLGLGKIDRATEVPRLSRDDVTGRSLYKRRFSSPPERAPRRPGVR